MATQTIDIVARDKTGAALNQIQRRLASIDRQASRISGTFGGIAQAAVGVFAGLGLGRVARDIVNTGRRFEDLRAQLKTVTGSAQNATKAFDQIQEFASTTPFQVDELTNSFIILKRSGIDTTTESLRAFGNVAAANGKSMEQFAEAVADATVGEFERLKEFGIKVSKEQEGFVVRLGSQILTTAENYDQVIDKIKELGAEGGRFGEGIENRAATLSGAISNFQDNLDAFNDAIGMNGTNGALRDLFIVMGDVINQARPLAAEIGQRLALQIQRLSNFIQSVDLRSFATGIGTVTKMIGAAGMTAAIFKAVGAIRALTIAIAANPIGFLITAVTTLMAYLAFDNGLGRTLTQINAVMNKMGEIFSAVGAFLRDSFIKIIDNITKAFDFFVDGIIDSLNAISEFLGQGKLIEKTSREIRGAVADVAVEGFQKVSESIAETADNIVGFVEQNETIQNVVGATTGVLSDVADAAREAGAAYDAQQAAAEEALKEQIVMNQAVTDGGAAISETAKHTAELTENTNAASKATKKMTEELEKMEEKYAQYLGETIVQAKDAYNDDLASFQKLLDQKMISEERYRQLKSAADRRLHDETMRLQKESTAFELQQIEARLDAQIAAGNFNLDINDRIRRSELMRMEETNKYEKFRNDYLKAQGKERVMMAIGFLSDELQALGKHNRAAFKAWKAFSIAKAIGDTIASAQAAFTSLAVIPFIGPVLGAAAAAAAIAAGMARVNQIRSLQYTGYAQGGEMTVNRPAVVGENGPEIIVPKNPSVVMPNSVKERLDGGQMKGPVTVNFNITTLDARDFDTMLIERRATITGIINDAMVRRGKVGVY
jgi:methyl-accepting chemotaxis protein